MLPYLVIGSLIELFLIREVDLSRIINWNTLVNILFLGFVGNIMSFSYIWSA
jgi:hypothetical protein